MSSQKIFYNIRYLLVICFSFHYCFSIETNSGAVERMCNAARDCNLVLLRSIAQQYNLSVNLQDEAGQTPLHHVAASQHEDKERVIVYLLSQGAQLDILDKQGNTPLDGLDVVKLSKIINKIKLKEEAIEKLNKEQGQSFSKQNLKADISYLFVDFKFDGKKIKILELGQGKNGGYRTYDGVFQKGKIWAKFWGYLHSLKIPFWLIAPNYYRSYRPANKLGISWRDRFAWNSFRRLGGKWAPSIKRLVREEDFLKAQNDRRMTDYSNLKSYKGIIVYRYRDDRDPKRLKELEKFKKQYPDFLVLDAVLRPYAASKELTNTLFKDADLQKYRPKCNVYPKKYTPNLAQRIMSDLGSEMFVIKPLNSGMSNGVIVVSKDQLDKALKRILLFEEDKIKRAFNYRPGDTVTYSYWKGDKNNDFIVEEYVVSKPIVVNGKFYDPSLRMVCVLDQSKGNIDLKFLQSWWKIPSKALSEKGTLTQKHVSKFRGDLSRLSSQELVVRAHDLTMIKAQLREVSPHLQEIVLLH